MDPNGWAAFCWCESNKPKKSDQWFLSQKNPRFLLANFTTPDMSSVFGASCVSASQQKHVRLTSGGRRS